MSAQPETGAHIKEFKQPTCILIVSKDSRNFGKQMRTGHRETVPQSFRVCDAGVPVTHQDMLNHATV